MPNRMRCVRSPRRVWIRLAAACVLTGAVCGAAAGAESPGKSAAEILAATGVRGGLIVHVGCGDARLTGELGASERYLVHGLDADAKNVEAARKHVHSKGLYGRVSIDRWDGRHLPYTDNLVNLVVVSKGADDLSKEEILRVLAPGGVAYVRTAGGEGGWRKTVKPRPDEIDEWTHYLHGADNNAVAHDRVVGVPYHVQWVGGPRWARHHNHLSSTSAMVSAGGRLFAIVDEGPIASLALPAKWRLVARDAFNGVVLWKRPVGPWEGLLRPFRTAPTELSRRLVADAKRVYATLGYGKPVVALDAATGRTLRTYDDTKGAVEILLDDGTLYAVVASMDAEAYAASARRRGASPPPHGKRIVALRAETGERLWAKGDDDTGELLPSTLCAAGGRVFFQSPRHVVALGAASGRVQWRAERAVRRKRVSWSTPTLVVHDDVVLSADCAAGEGKAGAVTYRVTAKPKRGNAAVGELIALSARDGHELWRCRTAQGYNAPPDVFVAAGLVWASAAPGRNTTDFTEARDLHSGEVKRRLDTAAAFDSAHHHRCYRDKATDRFILLGRTGVEFIPLGGQKVQRHCWVRGACQYGVMPANGLLYAPPHSCACYIQSKLSGLWALAPRRANDRVPTPGGRLERGAAHPESGKRSDSEVPLGREAESGAKPAVAEEKAPDNKREQIVNRKSKIGNDIWPTYRHDAARSGRTAARVPAELKPAWRTRIGGKLSGVVVADGTLLVAAVDQHTVCALDARSGERRWRFTAGGRVDSPPTIHNRLAIFGSADGFTYCLRLADGALVWRYRAAPADRRTVSFGQVESVWPVTGSVLVLDAAQAARPGPQGGAVVYCTAGRSSYLDGGMVLCRLDAATGKQLGRTRFASRDPKTGAQPESLIEDVELPGALPDVLVYDGRFVYLRDKRLTADGRQRPPTVAHLYSSAGLLDDTWWHRTYWTWGQRNWGRASGWFIAAAFRPSGRILVADEKTVFGYGRKRVRSGGKTLAGCHLFRAHKAVRPVNRKIKNNNKALVRHLSPAKVTYLWSKDVPVVARAMLLAGENLFVAGPVAGEGGEVDFTDAAAPAVVAAFAAEDGRQRSTCRLDAQPVFDGMAAARGRLYAALRNGQVVCLHGKK